jgi:hypothetical protein
MLFAGANFALLYRPSSGGRAPVARSGVPRVRGRAAGRQRSSSAGSSRHLRLADAVRHGGFQALSITTSTGYASADFAAWSPAAHGILGHADAHRRLGRFGGRRRQGGALAHPGGSHTREVRHTCTRARCCPAPRLAVGAEDVIRAVAAFITVYVVLTRSVTLVLVLVGSDEVTAFTATVATSATSARAWQRSARWLSTRTSTRSRRVG